MRLTALLRRRALERLLKTRLRATQEDLARTLTAAGFPASRVTVTKDLQLMNAVRRHECSWRLTRPSPEGAGR